jgi:hypothetical protein
MGFYLICTFIIDFDDLDARFGFVLFFVFVRRIALLMCTWRDARCAMGCGTTKFLVIFIFIVVIVIVGINRLVGVRLFISVAVYVYLYLILAPSTRTL